MATIIAYKARFETIEKVAKEATEPPEEAVDDIAVNLTPFFSRSMPAAGAATGVSDSYWAAVNPEYITALDGGWAHLEIDNTEGEATATARMQAKTVAVVSAMESVTLMAEVRNMSASGNRTLNMQNTNGSQQQINSRLVIADDDFTNGIYRMHGAVRPSGTQRLSFTSVQVPAGESLECDMRLSLYEGEYEDEYVPFLQSRVDELMEGGQNG